MSRMSRLRIQFWLEAGLGSSAGILTLLTLVRPGWIEIVSGLDPDGGSGLLEWGVVVALAAATVLFALLARAEWRQAAADAAG